MLSKYITKWGRHIDPFWDTTELKARSSGIMLMKCRKQDSEMEENDHR